MKTILPGILGFWLLVLGGFSHAIISINSVGGGGVGGAPTAFAPGDKAGVVPAANWNNVAQNLASGSTNILLDSSGAATSAGVSWSSDNTWNTGIFLQTS